MQASGSFFVCVFLEKMAVLKSLWSKEEERQATDKVSEIKPGSNKLYPMYLPNFPE